MSVPSATMQVEKKGRPGLRIRAEQHHPEERGLEEEGGEHSEARQVDP